MSIKLQLKESIFTILDLLPEKLGFYVYHKLQDILNGKNLLQRVKSNEGSFRILQKLLQNENISFQEKNVLEIGSGWAPIMPYLIFYHGKAKKVATYDLNRHFSKKNSIKLNEIFTSEYNIKINIDPNSSYHLPEQIRYYPKTNLVDTSLPDVDLVYSRFVLEHVKPEDILLMHQKFKRELKPGSTIVHLISPSDHRAHVDANLSLQDFLKYSEEEWENKQTRFDYHNRLRLPQYLDIFKKADVEILNVTYDKPDINSTAYKKFKALHLHKDFRNFKDEELTAGSINVVLRL